MEKYYQSITACVLANPKCTHVLGNNDQWVADPDLRGKYSPAYFSDGRFYTCPPDEDGTFTSSAFETFCISPKYWQVVHELDLAEKALHSLRQAIQDCEEQGYRVMFGNTQITGAIICNDTHTIELRDE